MFALFLVVFLAVASSLLLNLLGLVAGLALVPVIPCNVAGPSPFGDVGPGSGFHLIRKLRLDMLWQTV